MRLAVRLFAALTLAGALTCQSGPYYVNGLTGLDQPGRGLSAATPWKTLTYAFANVPALPLNNTVSDIIYVEGNQVYSPSTNGEVMPLLPAYNYWVEGTFQVHGVLPVFRAPAGGTAIAFPGNMWFNRNAVTFRYLVFENGAYAVRMGANPGYRHRPRFQDCVFRNQTSACIRMDNLGSSIDDPRFFQNSFTGSYRGIEVFAAGSGAIAYPDVEENTFTGITDRAIWVQDTSPGGGNVGGLFRSNSFEACAGGIYIESAQGAVTTNAAVRTSRFANLTGAAVEVLLVRPFDPSVTVEQCVMLNCGDGVRFGGTPLPGQYTLNLNNNTMRGCGNGLRVLLNGSGNVGITSRNNWFEQCSYASLLTLYGSGLQAGIAMQGDHIHSCMHGIDLTGSCQGQASIRSCLVAGIGLNGVRLNTSMAVQLQASTIADFPVGLQTTQVGTGSAFDHLILASSSANVVGTPVITYSCFQGSTYPGVGNLSNTDPQLLRPYYKLAPSSPCIDAGNVAASLPATDYEGDPRAAVSRVGGQPVPDLGADEYVLGGSARPYGTAGFGLYNIFPRIGSPTTQVRAGQPVQVDLTGASMATFGISATQALLVLGWFEDCGALPFDLSMFGMRGSYLLNDSAMWLALVPVTAGAASTPVQIPNLPGLAGLPFTCQWFAIMPQTYGTISSDGLRVTVGQ